MNARHLSFLMALALACSDGETKPTDSMMCGEGTYADGDVCLPEGDTATDANDNTDAPPSDDTGSPVETDEDGDGITVDDGDCDDTDPTLGDIASDADCDGILTADDCNDNDPESTTVADDADCDGTATAMDCDDSDAASTTMATDADCDGVTAADDCDDGDTSLGAIEEDADCDGVPDASECTATKTQSQAMVVYPIFEADFPDCSIDWTNTMLEEPVPAGCPDCDVAWWFETEITDDCSWTDLSYSGWMAWGLDLSTETVYSYTEGDGEWMNDTSLWTIEEVSVGSYSFEVSGFHDDGLSRVLTDTKSFTWTSGCTYDG